MTSKIGTIATVDCDRSYCHSNHLESSPLATDLVFVASKQQVAAWHRG